MWLSRRPVVSESTRADCLSSAALVTCDKAGLSGALEIEGGMRKQKEREALMESGECQPAQIPGALRAEPKEQVKSNAFDAFAITKNPDQPKFALLSKRAAGSNVFPPDLQQWRYPRNGRHVPLLYSLIYMISLIESIFCSR